MGEERARILKMLEEGKITADEAARLIEALGARRDRDEVIVGRHFRMPHMPRPPRPPRNVKVKMAELDRIPDIVAGAVSSAMRSGLGQQGEFKEEFPGKKSLFLKSVSGDVDIEAVDFDGIRLESTGGITKVREREEKVMVRAISGDFKVQLPAEARVELVSVSGDVNVTGVSGVFGLKSVSGDVELTGFSGEVEATVVSGDLSLDGFSGEVTAESKSGDISCHAAGTVDGSLTSKSGSIELELPAGADVVLDMECEEEGEIVVGPGLVYETLEEGEHRLRIKLGEGSSEVKLRTRDGEIKVTQAEEEE